MYGEVRLGSHLQRRRPGWYTRDPLKLGANTQSSRCKHRQGPRRTAWRPTWSPTIARQPQLLSRHGSTGDPHGVLTTPVTILARSATGFPTALAGAHHGPRPEWDVNGSPVDGATGSKNSPQRSATIWLCRRCIRCFIDFVAGVYDASVGRRRQLVPRIFVVGTLLDSA